MARGRVHHPGREQLALLHRPQQQVQILQQLSWRRVGEYGRVSPDPEGRGSGGILAAGVRQASASRAALAKAWKVGAIGERDQRAWSLWCKSGSSQGAEQGIVGRLGEGVGAC